ncbi:MAG: long-chain fatty acid--CoA ligase [Ignavibacteria bacterium]|nr:long-chain fatty acid--CoA ligase [Ignavibacteria bacterium]
MPLVTNFTTIPEMFDGVTTKYENIPRPLLQHKLDGKWIALTFAEVREMVEISAAGFSALGLKANDRVAIISENRPEWIICDQSFAVLGAISVPLYPTLTSKQIEEIFLDADVSYAIVSNNFQLKKLLPFFGKMNCLRKIIVLTDKELPAEENIFSFINVVHLGEKYLERQPQFYSECVKNILPEQLLTLIYTSGTTGTPKGAMLTHHNLVSNIKASVEVLPINANDVFLSYLPLCHAFERMAGYYTAMSCGATIAFAESIETVRDNLQEIHPTIMTSVPRMFERVYHRIAKQVSDSSKRKQKIFYRCVEIGKQYAQAKKSGDVSLVLKAKHNLAHKFVLKKIQEKTGGNIRFFVSGGGPLPKQLGEFFEAVGLQILEGYGLTESSPVLSVNRIEQYKFGTVGFPIPGVEITIADDGEILARGDNIMKGYWNDELATRRAIDEHGFLHTGDIGKFDEGGFLKITDRKKHIIVTSGGKKISPQQVESQLLLSKYIEQVVLIGDDRMFLSALIVPDFEMLKEIVNAYNIAYKLPSDIIARKEIREFYLHEIQRLQKDTANYERVRKFVLLDKPLSVENEELTPTLKVRRKIVEEKYQHLIEEMYKNVQ